MIFKQHDSMEFGLCQKDKGSGNSVIQLALCHSLGVKNMVKMKIDMYNSLSYNYIFSILLT